MSTATCSHLPDVVDELSFASTFIDELIAGDKWLTARYQFEREYEPGDRIALVTPGGHVFAIAVVDEVQQMSIQEFVAAELDGHKQYADVDSCIEALEAYYPDAPLTATTPLTVVFLAEVVDVNAYFQEER